MRTVFSMLLGTLFVTGCIFPSFDNMQKGSPSKDDDSTTESSPTEEIVKRIEIGGMDAEAEASVVTASPDAGVDAAPDVAVAPPPGAGKVACGGTDCTVGAKTYCCAGYGAPQFSCKNDDTFDDVLGCANGIAHALYCDEKADCATGQVCCHTNQGSGGVSRCAASCGGVVLCKTDADCPDAKKCTGSLDSDVPNKVCAP